MHIVIRAGGAGTRLWPVSRRSAPKQFQSILGPDSMIQKAVSRMRPLNSDNQHLWVSVNKNLVETLRKEIVIPEDHFIIEHETRNTGPGICLEVCFLEKKIPLDSVVASLPSDDYISNELAFIDLLMASERFILEHPEYVVAPAIKPDYPEVGYSYLKAGARLDEGGKEAMFAVVDLVEKPNREYCQELIESGVHYWHTGMYVWQLKRIIEIFEKYQPAMIESCRRIIATQDEEAAALYSSLEKVSIESAITHHVSTLAMSVSNHLGWSDVGKWSAVKRLSEHDQYGNVSLENAQFHNSSNNLVYNRNSKKRVILNNVKNIAVIETDDVLLISDLESTEDIKTIVDGLSDKESQRYI